MERENPLRRIVDYEHAKKILAAHNHHTNTDCDFLLDVARDKTLTGELERSKVKEFARKNFKAMDESE